MKTSEYKRENNVQYNKQNYQPNLQSNIMFCSYRSNGPIRWTQEFRDWLVETCGVLTLVPIKCGEKKKDTSTGVFTVPAERNLPDHLMFGSSLIRFKEVSESDFNNIQLSTKNKIFFKGFPLNATKRDVENLFCRFGRIQYIYFMCSPKTGKSNSRMGYFIFESRESVSSLLSVKTIKYFDYNISYEEYQSKKSKQEKGRTHGVYDVLGTQYNKCKLIHPDQREYKTTTTTTFRDSVHYNTRVEAVDRDAIIKSYQTREYLYNSRQVAKNVQSLSNLRFNIIKSSSSNEIDGDNNLL